MAQFVRTPTLDTQEDGVEAILNLSKRVEVLETALGRLYGQGASAPVRPAEGAIYFANGTDWDPGSGIGLYRYSLGTWTLL